MVGECNKREESLILPFSRLYVLIKRKSLLMVVCSDVSGSVQQSYSTTYIEVVIYFSKMISPK